MKQFQTLFIFGLILFISCKKDNLSNPNTLALLQNHWTSISSRLFAYNSVGNSILVLDSFQLFRNDGLLIDCKTKNVSYPNLPLPSPLLLDTLAYTLLQDNSTLLFYQIYNGTQNINADTVHIRTITDKLLVYYWNQGQGFAILDSLKR